MHHLCMPRHDIEGALFSIPNFFCSTFCFYLLIILTYFTLFSSQSTAVDPTFPTNGSIEPYQNTTEGAEILIGCNPMFVPVGRVTAVCGADGRWTPDPAGLVCTCKVMW